MIKKVLMTATVASMIDLFNMNNIRMLQELGYEVHVAGNFEEGNVTSKERVFEFRRELTACGVKTYHLPFPRSLTDVKSMVSTYRALKKLCEQEHYSIVHTQTPIGGVITRLAVKKARKKGTSVIYVAHGFHFYKGAPKKNWVLFYPIEKYASKYTDILVTINQEDYALAKHRMKAKKVAYIHGAGIDFKEYDKVVDKEKKRQELGISRDAFVLIHVAEFSKNKNQETVIRAMEQLKEKNIVYLMCGIGEEKERLETYTQQQDLGQHVKFAGYRKDIADLLKIADCFVFSSFREGLSVAMMEAMAAGLPVICSNIRGNVDLIDEEGGKLVSPESVSEFKQAIEEMYLCAEYTPEKFAEMGRYNQEKVKGFSSKIVDKEMKKIYMEL